MTKYIFFLTMNNQTLTLDSCHACISKRPVASQKPVKFPEVDDSDTGDFDCEGISASERGS